MARLLIAVLAVLAASGADGAVGMPVSRAWADSAGLSFLRNDTAGSVEIRSGDLLVVVRVEPWHLELRDRWTNRLVAEEYPSHDPKTGETTIAIPGSVRKAEVDGPVSLLRRELGGR